MLGLIKKDFLIIKANLKSMVITFIVYLMLAFQGTFDVTFIIPIIGIMLFISTFSYDDFNNWNSYAVTLPDGRRNVVRAKYIASIILTVVLGIIALAIGIGISYIKTNAINLNEIISSTFKFSSAICFTKIASPVIIVGSILLETITKLFIPKNVGVLLGFKHDLITSVILNMIIGIIIIYIIMLITFSIICIFLLDLSKSFNLYTLFSPLFILV